MAGKGQRHDSNGRVRHPKVKTGCITCRNRRVKCDETRPACIRCQKYGAECEGYPAGRKRPPSSQYGSFASQARALVPKNQRDQILAFPSLALFETERESQYFRLFSERLAAEISPYFNSEPWTRMLLQACANEETIRHAATAIGALGKTHEIAQLGQSPITERTLKLDGEAIPVRRPGARSTSKSPMASISSETMELEAYVHHREALEQYDKAIKRMMKEISSGSQSLRTTLIICIILTCFEAIHGNHEMAAAQLQGGLAVLQEWKSKQRDSSKHPQGFSSPAPDVVDDYLVQVFGRMEIQSMSVFDPRPVAVHVALRTEGREVVQQMPKEFMSLEQAQIYHDLIIRRMMHFNAAIHDPRATEGGCFPPPRNIPWSAVVGEPMPMPWIDGKIPTAKTVHTLSSPDILAEQRALTNELDSWMQAFKPILAHARAAGGQDAISALTLAISSISSQISLRAAFFITEVAYDIFLPEFKTIVSYADILLRTQESLTSLKNESTSNSASPSGSSPRLVSPAGSVPNNSTLRFAFEIGVVPQLYLVAIKCRERALRREALRLLRQYPRREGVWDTVATTALGEWVMRLEEEGASRWSRSPSAESPGSSASGGTGGGVQTVKIMPPAENAGNAESAKSGPTRASIVSGLYQEKGGLDAPIPEEMRVRKALMRFDLLERRANMSCMQMDFERGVFVNKVEVYRW